MSKITLFIEIICPQYKQSGCFEFFLVIYQSISSTASRAASYVSDAILFKGSRLTSSKGLSIRKINLRGCVINFDRSCDGGNHNNNRYKEK